MSARIFRRLAIALAAVLLAASAAAAERPRVLSVGTTVADADRSVAFFTGVLGFEKIGEHEIAGEAWERLHGVFGARARVVELRLGSETLVLTQYLTPRGRRIPEDSRSNDRWFQHVAIVVSDMDAAYARLREHGVRQVSTDPQRLPDWNPNAGGIRAFYFEDPDGHDLEIIWYPPGKGDPRWQRRDGRLFLGIDHTAIVVSSTERSLAFWRDVLGLAVVGGSENWGPEQERLNQVFGARLRITALRGSAGPGVEFLEYLAPGDGRPSPADLRASDLAHWEVTVEGPDLSSVEGAARDGGGRLVSPGAVETPGTELGFRRGELLRDPDGHGVEIVER